MRLQSLQLPPQKNEILALLAEHHQLCFSFPGSAWERTAPEALPRVAMQMKRECPTIRQAEPARQWVPKQSLGTSEWRSPRSVEILS